MVWQWGSSFLLLMGQCVPLVWGGGPLPTGPTAYSLAIPSLKLASAALGVHVPFGEGGHGMWKWVANWVCAHQ